MDKFLCSLACTWMTTIDSQFYIIDSLSEMFHWNKMLNWLVTTGSDKLQV